MCCEKSEYQEARCVNNYYYQEADVLWTDLVDERMCCEKEDVRCVVVVEKRVQVESKNVILVLSLFEGIGDVFWI